MARIGLVLGAGGVVGHAFHAGVLSALAEQTGADLARAEVMVGTSAGSVVASLLRAGVSPLDLAAPTLGRPLSERARQIYDGATRAGWAPGRMPRGRRPLRLGMASPGMLAGAALRPWRVRPGAVAAALLPPGRIPTGMISAWLAPAFPQGWPTADLWICAVALSDGRRVVFGRADSPEATVAQAVAASCAIPGVFEPVDIGGVLHVDGGVHSPTNADLLTGRGLDLVLVSSPMSAARPLSNSLDMAGRRISRATLAREAAALRRAGTEVLAFQPTAEDRAVMGVNAMDPRRRESVTRQARESTLRRLERPDVADRLALLRAA